MSVILVAIMFHFMLILMLGVNENYSFLKLSSDFWMAALSALSHLVYIDTENHCSA